MVVKSSVNENKEYAIKMLPSHQKDHESGRGEVASFVLCTFLLSTVTFSPFSFGCFQLGIVPNNATPDFSEIGKVTEIISKKYNLLPIYILEISEEKGFF